MKCIYKGLPNWITLLRVILTSILNIFIIYQYGSVFIQFIIFLIILFTDFIDGRIARFYGSTSLFGAIFDIFADLFFILSISFVLYYLRILPLWFLLVIILKFIEFVITSYLLKKRITVKSAFVFDFLGRLTASLFFIIPIVAYILFQIHMSKYLWILDMMLLITTLMAIASALYRIWSYIGVNVRKNNVYSENPATHKFNNSSFS